ncbi:MAG: hypothetical protein ACRDCW_06430 [Sarcina sp.]
MTNINIVDDSKVTFPSNPKYFKEEVLSQIYTLDSCYSDIDDLIDFIGNISIESYNFKKEEIGLSVEGNYRSGEKVNVAVKLKGKLTYNTKCQNTGVNIVFFEFIKKITIVIPQKINNKYTCDLIRSNRFIIKPYIEDLYCRKINLRRIHISAILFVDFNFC